MTHHCCEAMTDRVDMRCAEHDDPFACPDALVDFSAKFQEYGLIIHDEARRVSRSTSVPGAGGGSRLRNLSPEQCQQIRVRATHCGQLLPGHSAIERDRILP